LNKRPDAFEQELLDLTNELELCVRFDSKSGSVTLYEHLGEWECAEQAVLALRQMIKDRDASSRASKNRGITLSLFTFKINQKVIS